MDLLTLEQRLYTQLILIERGDVKMDLTEAQTLLAIKYKIEKVLNRTNCYKNGLHDMTRLANVYPDAHGEANVEAGKEYLDNLREEAINTVIADFDVHAMYAESIPELDKLLPFKGRIIKSS